MKEQDKHNSPVDVMNKAIHFFEEYKKGNAQLEGEAKNLVNIYWPMVIIRLILMLQFLTSKGFVFGLSFEIMQGVLFPISLSFSA